MIYSGWSAYNQLEEVSANMANLPYLKLYHPHLKEIVSMKDIFSHENILRALRESTEDQRKVLFGK